MEREEIVSIFPATLRRPWELCEWNWDEIEEIRIRVNRPVIMKGKEKEYIITQTGEMLEVNSYNIIDTCVIFREKDLEEMLRHLCRDSIYAYEEERRQGYLTMPGGHRVGITGELTYINNQSYIAKYIRYINIRIAHEMKGIANTLMEWLTDSEQVWNTLLVSAPGAGKTTLLRDIVRNLSNKKNGYSVGVIDERGEIAGAYRGVASLDCGMRTDVITGGNKEQGTRILIRTFAPRVIVMDEIGTKEDADAVLYAGISGCNIFATVHGSCWNDLKQKKEINQLIENQVFKRIIFLNKCSQGQRWIEIWDGEGRCLCGEKLLQEY